MKIDCEKTRRPFRNVIATGVACLILLTPTISLGWGAGGHMMTASIAFGRLNPRARAKANELLAIEIDPVSESAQSKDFVNASHWADDLRDFKQFDFLLFRHFINIPFTTDGTPLPADLPNPDNILKALADNVNILKTSSDKNEQAQALRLIIHFVGDIHQPLHSVARITKAHPDGDRGANSFSIKLRQSDGTLKDSNLHSYWDGGINTFPKQGPPPGWDPPPLSEIPAAVAKVRKGNPANNRKLKLKQPFNFKLWSNESLALAKSTAYKGIEENGEPTAAYNAKAIPVVRRRVAWGGYRLAALLNAIWK